MSYDAMDAAVAYPKRHRQVMKDAIDPSQFRVAEGSLVDLLKWPTHVKQRYRSKKDCRNILAQRGCVAVASGFAAPTQCRQAACHVDFSVIMEGA